LASYATEENYGCTIEDIEDIPELIFNSEDPIFQHKDCAICQETFQQNEQVLLLDC
jgi:hypothetical protein